MWLLSGLLFPEILNNNTALFFQCIVSFFSIARFKVDLEKQTQENCFKIIDFF